MPQKVLIVEDEASASRLVAALCAEVGLAVLETRSGNEAKTMLERAAAAGESFAALVLDLVLGDYDGFRLGQFLRSQPRGANTPLIVISGVYKQANPELMRELRPLAYFAKPFEPAQLRDALVKACNVQGVATAVEGDLSQKPTAALFVDLLRQKASGVLTVTTDSAVRKIHFQQGQVRYAQSSVLAESAGSAQVASGLIKQASFDRAVAMSRQNKVPLHEALAHSRVMSLEQLKAVVRQQTAEASLNALPMDSGTYRFEPQTQGLVDSVPDARMSPVTLIVDAAKRFATAADSKKWLEARRDSTLARTPELDRDLFAVRQAWPGEGVTTFATGGRGVQEALSRVKEAELPLLHWLCVSGLVQLAGGQKAQPSPVAENRAVSEPGLPTDVGMILRAEEVFQRGEKLFKSGKWDEAEAAFREAVSLNNAEAEFHAYLGMAMFRRRGDASEAVSFVERALEMDPRLKSGMLFRAQICEAQGDLEKAKSILGRAVEQDPGFEEAREELGRLRSGPPGPEKKGLLTRLLKK